MKHSLGLWSMFRGRRTSFTFWLMYFWSFSLFLWENGSRDGDRTSTTVCWPPLGSRVEKRLLPSFLFWYVSRKLKKNLRWTLWPKTEWTEPLDYLGPCDVGGPRWLLLLTPNFTVRLCTSSGRVVFPLFVFVCFLEGHRDTLPILSYPVT